MPRATILGGVLQEGGVPSGMILAWSGAISAIPAGWYLCDGTAGTPDLTDRFILHADADAAGTNNVGDTGGAKTHTLLTAEMPSHTHNMYTAAAGAQGVASRTAARDVPSQDETSPTGGGTAHNNRDKYHALAYIMKG